MKKSKVSAFFLIILSCGSFLSMSHPKYYLNFLNNRNESVFLQCQANPELAVVINGKTYYILKYENEEIGNLNAGGDGYDRIYEIKPNGVLSCYWMDAPMRWEAGPNFQFLELTPLEQLKVIYASLSVKDKDGNEILNLETIQLEDFVIVGRMEKDKILIIK